MYRVAAATLILIAMFFVGIADAQQTRLYRWVDEDGKVHFSDRLEPSSGTSDYDRFNASGVRISQPDRPQSRQQRREAEQVRRSHQRDQALLAAHPTELALLRAHDEQRARVEFNLRASQANVERIQRDIRARADSRPDGGGDDRELAELNRRLQAERKNLEQLQVYRFELYETQNQEIERFRELHESAAADSFPSGVNGNQIPD
ncbi:MAG: DUF4124 domain-containing protein [Xanthomonadales bacterium]|nr:DUF4124 domain-containing protein [Xanthomonadales bacterium]